MRKYLVILILFFAVCANAQPVINFEKTEHDFGTMKEEQGTATHNFVFKNTGDKPLVIKKVSTDCGCTSPEWTKEPIQPGASGAIKVMFSTAGRPYPFAKKITVTSNTEPETTQLTITGVVTRKRENYRETYKDSIGDLRFKSLKQFNFPSPIADNKENATNMFVANASETQSIRIEVEAPPYIRVYTKPQVIQPRGTAEFVIGVIGSARKGMYGFRADDVIIKVGDQKGKITVGSAVYNTYPELSGPDIEKGPRIKANEQSITIIENKNIAKITVTNSGKSELKVYNCTFDCNYLSSTLVKPLKIKSQNTGELVLNINKESLRKGKYTCNAYIESNDPQTSLIVVPVTFEIK